MADQDPAAKWDRIYASGGHGCGNAARVLTEFQHLLPASADALDPACGMGANVLLLAGLGLRTHAWDISGTAIEQLAARAAALDVRLYVEQRDAVARPPAPESFDVIVVSRFLDRSLIPHLRRALRRDGLIFYQTFIKEKVDDSGPRNPDFRLDNNELLRLFADLHIVYYHEEGVIGRTGMGLRNEAMLIAQRR